MKTLMIALACCAAQPSSAAGRARRNSHRNWPGRRPGGCRSTSGSAGRLSDPLAKPAPAWQPIPARRGRSPGVRLVEGPQSGCRRDGEGGSDLAGRLPRTASEDDLLVRVAGRSP